jgi:thymidine phosphorylase
VDPGVGIFIDAPVGTPVSVGMPLASLDVRSEQQGLGVTDRIRRAFTVGDAAVAPRPLVLARIEAYT